MSQPPSTQSVAERRIQTVCARVTAARTASNTSRGKRMRFSSEPPYSSSRRLEIGDRNSCSRYPCAPCSSMASKPSRSARRAVATKSSRTLASPARSSASGASSPSECGSGGGRHRHPTVRRVGRDLLAAVPGFAARRLAAGVRELDAERDRRNFSDRADDVAPAPPRWRRCRGRDRPGVMRPSADIAVASKMSSPAPDSARCPR